MKAQGQINPQRNIMDSSEGRQQGTGVTGGREELGFPYSPEFAWKYFQGEQRSRNSERCSTTVPCHCSRRLRSGSKAGGTRVLGVLGQAASNLQLI